MADENGDFERTDNPQSDAADDLNSEQEISDVFNYSPFDKGESETESSESAEVNSGSKAESSQSEAPAQSDSQSNDAMQQELNQLRQQLQQMQQSQQPQTQGSEQGQSQGQSQQGQSQEQEAPAYDFNIPDELLKQMDAADDATRKQALGNMLKGTAQAVDQRLRAEFGQQLQQLRQEIPQQAQQTVTQTAEAEQVKQDFFGNYPQLDRQELKPLIQNAAQQVLQETNAQQWSPQLRDKIASRVNEVLRGAGAAPANAGNGQQPPRQFGGGSRPNTQGSNENSSADIEATLFG